MGDGGRRPQLITFCDAGYASLRESSSVESCVILYGVPYKRNGPIEWSGNAVTFYTRKISRVCRSSAHAEGVALANAADLTLYTQCVMSEIPYRQHDFSFLHQSHDFSLMTPFKRPPSASDIRTELRSFKSVCESPNARSSILFMQNGHDLFYAEATCSKCSHAQCVPITCCNYFTTLTEVGEDGKTNELGPIPHALILSDCSDTVSAVHQGNPRTDEKCYRIICCYLKDFLRFLSVNYCNAAFNMSDTGAKRSSTIQIWRQFLQFGTFKIGFLSRKECKNLSMKGMLWLVRWLTWVCHLKGFGLGLRLVYVIVWCPIDICFSLLDF